MANITVRVRRRAIDILKDAPEGIRFSELVKQVQKAEPSLNKNTIYTQVSILDKEEAGSVSKPERGLFLHKSFINIETDEIVEVIPSNQAKVREDDFYEPFARWLVDEVEECSQAIALGGNKFGGKWGTPDVIGIKKSEPDDIIRMPTQVVSAEVKPDTHHLVTAFGQASAYCLFSHKVYLVVAKESLPDEIGRIDALCQMFGIGLVLFVNSNAKEPQFEIRCRPRLQQPDLFYANKHLKHIKKKLAF